MTGTPEEDLLAWLEREEEQLGFTSVDGALGDIEKARALFYDELGYDITDDQFRGLQDALATKYEELPSIGVSYGRIEQDWGYQPVYRDLTTGRFISGSDVQSALGVLRGQ